MSLKITLLPEVREFITRHTAYNKHDTVWAIILYATRSPHPGGGQSSTAISSAIYHVARPRRQLKLRLEHVARQTPAQAQARA